MIKPITLRASRNISLDFMMTARMWINAKVSDGSQPPMTLNSSLGESAGSRSLDRLVR
jgi:hypothetical protein